jgi:hypothetical protein
MSISSLSPNPASVKSNPAIISPVERYLARLAEQVRRAENAHGIAAALASVKAERLAHETEGRLEKLIASIEASIEVDFISLDEATAALRSVRETQALVVIMADERVAHLRRPARSPPCPPPRRNAPSNPSP